MKRTVKFNLVYQPHNMKTYQLYKCLLRVNVNKCKITGDEIMITVINNHHHIIIETRGHTVVLVYGN